MSTDHIRGTDVDEVTSPGISSTLEFIMIMVITGVVALGGVAFLIV